jgi:hypothetical protein
MAVIIIIKSWITPIFIAALNPTIAHKDGIINKLLLPVLMLIWF